MVTLMGGLMTQQTKESDRTGKPGFGVRLAALQQGGAERISNFPLSWAEEPQSRSFRLQCPRARCTAVSQQGQLPSFHSPLIPSSSTSAVSVTVLGTGETEKPDEGGPGLTLGGEAPHPLPKVVTRTVIVTVVLALAWL